MTVFFKCGFKFRSAEHLEVFAVVPCHIELVIRQKSALFLIKSRLSSRTQHHCTAADFREKIHRQTEKARTSQRHRLHLINYYDRIRQSVHPLYRRTFSRKQRIQKLHHSRCDNRFIPVLCPQLIFTVFVFVLYISRKIGIVFKYVIIACNFLYHIAVLFQYRHERRYVKYPFKPEFSALLNGKPHRRKGLSAPCGDYQSARPDSVFSKCGTPVRNTPALPRDRVCLFFKCFQLFVHAAVHICPQRSCVFFVRNSFSRTECRRVSVVSIYQCRLYQSFKHTDVE